MLAGKKVYDAAIRWILTQTQLDLIRQMLLLATDEDIESLGGIELTSDGTESS
jgi:hypothetical protein